MANRDIALLRGYHEATKHSPESVSHAAQGLDWANQPRPFKVYTSLQSVPLARDLPRSTAPALEAIADPGLAMGTGPPLDQDLLAHVLYFTAGVLRRRSHPGGDAYFRAAACTGNLHHVDLYLTCGPLPDLDAGVYHFAPHDFALHRLRTGDHRRRLVEATGGDPSIADAPAVLAFASTFWRNSWKYRARAYRHAFWDSGTLLANLLALCAARELPARIVLGFVDDALNALLGLDGEREAALGLVALGRGGEASLPQGAPEMAPLTHEVLPLSAHEIDYPEIGAAHAASKLETPQEVVAWQRSAEQEGPPVEPASADERAASAAPTAADGRAIFGVSHNGGSASRFLPLVPRTADQEPGEPIEAVILRRGSTRAFAHDAIDFSALSTILRTVSRGIPADFVAPAAQRGEIHLIAHAVDGLAPGAYLFDRRREALLLLREGRFRDEAGFLDLGQELAADAAANLYWLADLEPILERLGNRGYRAAQLEAAIGGGKAYLASFALGLGASGLTFFDDEVTRFFSPRTAAKSVMFLMALGVPRRVRRA